MDRIRLRNLLDQAQAKLAQAAVGGSHRWRSYGLPQASVPEGLAAARQLIQNAESSMTPMVKNSTTMLSQSMEAMILLIEHPSDIRTSGDVIAHDSILKSAAEYEESLARMALKSPDTAKGMRALFTYICDPVDV
jgi:hypothetical protein